MPAFAGLDGYEVSFFKAVWARDVAWVFSQAQEFFVIGFDFLAGGFLPGGAVIEDAAVGQAAMDSALDIPAEVAASDLCEGFDFGFVHGGSVRSGAFLAHYMGNLADLPQHKALRTA